MSNRIPALEPARRRARVPRWMWLAPLALLPVVAFAVPATLRIPRNKPRQMPAADALFSHAEHAAQPCYSCHPSVFPQERQGFTHAEMNEGRYCGTCHDGQRAAAIASFKCETCHVPEARK